MALAVVFFNQQKMHLVCRFTQCFHRQNARRIVAAGGRAIVVDGTAGFLHKQAGAVIVCSQLQPWYTVGIKLKWHSVFLQEFTGVHAQVLFETDDVIRCESNVGV